jgi:hypothetical protein
MSLDLELIAGFGLSFELIYNDEHETGEPKWCVRLILGILAVTIYGDNVT